MFWRNVVHGTDQGACGGQPLIRRAECATQGEPKIQQLYLTPRRDHDVGRLDVAMDDAEAMRIRQRLQHLARVTQ